MRGALSFFRRISLWSVGKESDHALHALLNNANANAGDNERLGEVVRTAVGVNSLHLHKAGVVAKRALADLRMLTQIQAQR
eukprot:10223981-Alexandrium_andersonii.AAC.1